MDADRRPIRVMIVGASLIEERTIKAAVEAAGKLREAFAQMNRVLVEEKVAFRIRDFADHVNVIQVCACSDDNGIDPARRYALIKNISPRKARPYAHERHIRRQHK